MKAEVYLCRFLKKAKRKSKNDSERLAKKLATERVIHAIMEGPDISLARRTSYVD